MTSQTFAEIEGAIQAQLASLSAAGPVLFLTSGGSATSLCATVVSGIPWDNLTIGQVDERYGDIDHANANWPKLRAQLHDVNGQCVPMLTGVSREETMRNYEDFLKNYQGTVVALFGVGMDSHTAGILPGSSATTVEDRWVYGYQGPDFARITITPAFMLRIDQAFLYAQGPEKLAVLERYHEDHDPLLDPVQFLKRIEKLQIFHQE